ncbi:hypothetical protein VBQ38_13075 [Klebsiella pneumoniae]|uniref:hypothetical protein n=1 Tax=Klebsiella pneumoniae TaxID=573 RepID=UPI002D7D6375|nr:hypothetical protein [Klebsiella pneumoniae]MEA4599074.1 hypothetical protein [Klebsiella pneumoniae]MEC4507335.1 hypothetical protein [Klebsiella pneumoniae]HDO6740541.1 hypothetical protein [Klebsiella pneumoniae]
MQKISIDSIHDVVLKTFISICVVLPTGSVFDINIKFIFLFLVLGLAVFARKGKGIVKLMIGMMPAVFIVLVFLIVTMLNVRYIPETIAQSKDILVFFLMASISYSLVDKERRYEVITKTIINCLVVIGIIKFLIFAFAALTGGSVAGVVSMISKIFNTSLMTMESDDVSISRINFMSDYILPMAIFIKTKQYLRKGSPRFSSIVIIILMYSIIISLSRFLWAAGLLGLAMGIASDINKKKSLLIILFAIIMIAIVLSLPSVQEVIEFRMASKGVERSDDLRTLQSNAIYREFEKAPLLGNGIGYYVPSLLRSTLSRYSYELQIQALYMQMGIIGASTLLLLIIGTLLTQIRGFGIKNTLFYCILICLWMAGGFFNPVILSSTGGVAFMLLFCIPDAINRMNNKGRTFP